MMHNLILMNSKANINCNEYTVHPKSMFMMLDVAKILQITFFLNIENH